MLSYIVRIVRSRVAGSCAVVAVVRGRQTVFGGSQEKSGESAVSRHSVVDVAGFLSEPACFISCIAVSRSCCCSQHRLQY